jgi:hypothetical protein
MCMSPKIPKPPEPPASPPPPTAVAETVEQPEQKTKVPKKRSGVASLVNRRPSLGGLGIKSGVNTSNY